MGITNGQKIVKQWIEVEPIYNLLKSNISRINLPITVIFIKAQCPNLLNKNELFTIENEITTYLERKVRDTDLLFKCDEVMQWGILLIGSGEVEAAGLLNRLYQSIKDEKYDFYLNKQCFLNALVFEIKNSQIKLSHLYLQKELQFEKEYDAWTIINIPIFKKRDTEIVKISILEDNEIFRKVLQRTIENIKVEHLDIQVKCFADGYEFLQSDWYISSHQHIVILNDILPQKNGIEVVYNLRKMPNHKKFTIYMMTKRNTQQDMIYAYESGIDEYLVKPFNMRLLEAQLSRTFERV